MNNSQFLIFIASVLLSFSVPLLFLCDSQDKQIDINYKFTPIVHVNMTYVFSAFNDIL
jgi:hypothetical protein